MWIVVDVDVDVDVIIYGAKCLYKSAVREDCDNFVLDFKAKIVASYRQKLEYDKKFMEDIRNKYHKNHFTYIEWEETLKEMGIIHHTSILPKDFFKDINLQSYIRIMKEYRPPQIENANSNLVIVEVPE